MPYVAMIGGPNGSGKSTLIGHLREQGIDLGEYINADDIAAGLTGSYESRTREAQKIADERRAACLRSRVDFSFETVMSHVSKVEFLRACRDQGYDTVLYFVSTQSPELNVARVAQRVALGGHDVDRDRIISRYARAMDYLPLALSVAARAAVFDNSDADGLKLGLSKHMIGGAERFRLSQQAPDWIRQLAPDNATMF